MSDKYAGADWVQSNFKVSLSPIGVAVADLLGQLFRGIYHLEPSSLKKVDWNNPHQISIVLSKNTTLSTYDFNELTMLVVLCHDRLLRCEIGAKTFGQLELRFHQRKATGGITERHPTIEEQTQWCREKLG